MNLPDKFPTSESDWKYNGPFSNSSEMHMGIIGIGIGLFLGLSETIREEISEEPHYFIGLAIVSFIIAYTIGDKNE